MCREVYLDNSATTRPYDEVIEYMGNINRHIYGNPSSMHRMGLDAEKLIKKARETIAGVLKVDGKEIYFTSGGTESNNLAIMGYLHANPRMGRHIITTKVEHPSVLETFKHLTSAGYEADYVDVDNTGRINLESLEKKINSGTSLISIINVNNEVGTIQPIDDVVKIRNSINATTAIHVDAVQAFGKIDVFPAKTGIDLMSVSSHKIHGPKGSGALYVNHGIKIKPVMYGGGQESALRSGTENVTGICGFGLACEITFRNIGAGTTKAAELKKRFEEGLRNISGNCRIISPACSSPYILNVSFPGLRGEVLLHHLEEKGIFVSTGSACSSRKKRYSHVLQAMGLERHYMEGAVRFSFSVFNNEEEMEYVLKVIRDVLPALQKRNNRLQ